MRSWITPSESQGMSKNDLTCVAFKRFVLCPFLLVLPCRPRFSILHLTPNVRSELCCKLKPVFRTPGGAAWRQPQMGISLLAWRLGAFRPSIFRRQNRENKRHHLSLRCFSNRLALFEDCLPSDQVRSHLHRGIPRKTLEILLALY